VVGEGVNWNHLTLGNLFERAVRLYRRRSLALTVLSSAHCRIGALPLRPGHSPYPCGTDVSEATPFGTAGSIRSGLIFAAASAQVLRSLFATGAWVDLIAASPSFFIAQLLAGAETNTQNEIHTRH
jgi:hypothetical protein